MRLYLRAKCPYFQMSQCHGSMWANEQPVGGQSTPVLFHTKHLRQKMATWYWVPQITDNFEFFASWWGESELTTDPRFVDNSSRVQNRLELKKIFERILRKKTTEAWLAVLEGSGMPYGPINTVEQVFSHPQTAAGDMVQSLPHEAAISGKIKVLGLFYLWRTQQHTFADQPFRSSC